MKFKPPPADIMDRLVHRSDDQEEAIRNRLKGYHSQIDGIVPYFKDGRLGRTRIAGVCLRFS